MDFLGRIQTAYLGLDSARQDWHSPTLAGSIQFGEFALVKWGWGGPWTVLAGFTQLALAGFRQPILGWIQPDRIGTARPWLDPYNSMSLP